jgi:hypothetical protein
LLTDITDADVAALVAWRRGHRVIRSRKQREEDAPLISNATVNRSTTGSSKSYSHTRQPQAPSFAAM